MHIFNLFFIFTGPALVAVFSLKLMQQSCINMFKLLSIIIIYRLINRYRLLSIDYSGYTNLWTVSSDVSIQMRHWQPLSVHLWAYCTHPTLDVNDVLCCVKVDHTTGVYAPPPPPPHTHTHILSDQWCGFFTSCKNQICLLSAVRRDLRVFVLIRED